MLAIEVAGAYLLKSLPALSNNMLYQGIFLFGLPLLIAVALVGAVLAALGAVKSRLFGPNLQARIGKQRYGL